jgi:integrase
VIWEDRRTPLSGPPSIAGGTAASPEPGVVDKDTTHGKKMHGARYTCGTELYFATGDTYATQQLLGHANVSTTANNLRPGLAADLEAKLRKVWGE